MTKEYLVTTLVDEDVPYRDDLFFKKVKKTLTDPEGWRKVANVKFNVVKPEIYLKSKSKHKIPIRLSRNKTISEECGFGLNEKLSCCDMLSKRVWLNYDRWKNGAKASKLPLGKYRDYMINHEVGHALGRLHAVCPCVGCPAPIMMQHTITIGQCVPNNKPLYYE